MDTINHILKYIYLNIPEEILNYVFKSDKNLSMDSIIKEKIIVDIVLRRCNLYTGKLKKILLKESYKIKTRSDIEFLVYSEYSLYKIPPQARENKDILDVISVYPSTEYASNIVGYDVTPNRASNVSEAVLDSITGDNIFITPDVKILDNNVILLTPPQPIVSTWIANCMLKYDEYFTNLSPNAIRYVEKLGLYATQQYIYNKLRVQLDKGFLIGGQELTAIKNVVDEYKDARNKFDQVFEDFRGAAFFDKDIVKKIFAMMV
jgi:hypothetical protein